MAVGNSKLVSLNLLKNGKRRSSAAHHKNLESIHVLQDAGIAHTQREYWESRLKKNQKKEESHHDNPSDSWWLQQRRIQRALSAIDTHDSIKIKDSLTDADFQNLRLDLVASSPRVEGAFGKMNFNGRSINPTTTGVVVDLDDLKNTDAGINSGLMSGFVDPTTGNVLVTPSIENAKSQSEPPPSSAVLDSQSTMRLVGVDSVEIYQLQQQLEDSYDDLEKTRRELIETKDKLDDATQELQQLREDTDTRIRTEVAKQSRVWQQEKQKMQVEEAKRKAKKLGMKDKEVQTSETTFDGALGFASVSYMNGDVIPEHGPMLSAYSSHEYLEDDPSAPNTPNRRRSSSGMEIVIEDKFADFKVLSDKRSQSSTASESDDLVRKPKDMQKFAPIMEDDEFESIEDRFAKSSPPLNAAPVSGSLNEAFEKKSIGGSLENVYVDGDDFMSVGSRTIDNADGLDDVDETTALIPKNDEELPKEKQQIKKKAEKVVEDFGTAKKLGIEDDSDDFSTQKGGENLRTGRNQAMFQDLDDKCCGCICCHQSFGW